MRQRHRGFCLNRRCRGGERLECTIEPKGHTVGWYTDDKGTWTCRLCGHALYWTNAWREITPGEHRGHMARQAYHAKGMYADFAFGDQRKRLEALAEARK